MRANPYTSFDREETSMKNSKTPTKWRYTWEAQSHSPTLRLFLFDSLSRPATQCKNLNVCLVLSQSQLLVTWNDEEEENEEVLLRVPVPKVLIDTESPLSFKALDDHIEVRLLLLLPVDHPILSSFDSVLSLSENGGKEFHDAFKPLVMNSDVKSLSSIEGVHFYCRNCSNKLTRSPLRDFSEMPSVNWQEAADNWFGTCCCSFGGISDKLVTTYANFHACRKGLGLLTCTTVTLSKDDLEDMLLLDINGTREVRDNPSVAADYGASEAMLCKGSSQEGGTDCDSLSENRTQERECGGGFVGGDVSKETIIGYATNYTRGTSCDSQIHSFPLNCDHVEDEIFNAGILSEVKEEENKVHSYEEVPDLSKDIGVVPDCCAHLNDHSYTELDNVCTPLLGQKILNNTELAENKKFFLNGFLEDGFMARSSSLSKTIKWIQLACPQCSCLLGAYPSAYGNAPVDGGVRFFKCYISTSLPTGGSNNVFRKYTLERMFTNQLVENAKDELSFRTIVRDLTTKSPLLQIIILNPNTWWQTGYCLNKNDTMESALKSDLCPVVKVLYSDCRNSTESESRILQEHVTKDRADEVFVLRRQAEELNEFLASGNKALPHSCAYLQGLPLSSLLL